MKKLKSILIILFLLCSIVSFAQAKGEAWFYALDHANKVMYVTELQYIVVEDKYNNPNAWRNGFVELMNWQNRTPSSYFVSFNWMSTNHSKWYASEKESREQKINAFKQKNYTLKWIDMPQPKNPVYKQSYGSGQ